MMSPGLSPDQLVLDRLVQVLPPFRGRPAVAQLRPGKNKQFGVSAGLGRKGLDVI